MARHRALEMFGRSGNPAFRSKAFTHRSSDFSTNEVMTLSGASIRLDSIYCCASYLLHLTGIFSIAILV
ncbi:MAG: hypothetical protein Ct9H90mP13_01030 [Pseudomonadota bacterium]|nr:MAG: hypothetical protein Ct9H90mP13_01030 [Pseudomonadota bacterium]